MKFLVRVLLVVLALGVSSVLFPAQACACGGRPLTEMGVVGFIDLLFPPVLQLIAVALAGAVIISKLERIGDGAFTQGFVMVGVALLLQFSLARGVLSVPDPWILHAGSVAVGGTGLLLIERARSRNRSAEIVRLFALEPQARREVLGLQINRNRRVVSPGVTRIAVR